MYIIYWARNTYFFKHFLYKKKTKLFSLKELMGKNELWSGEKGEKCEKYEKWGK